MQGVISASQKHFIYTLEVQVGVFLTDGQWVEMESHKSLSNVILLSREIPIKQQQTSYTINVNVTEEKAHLNIASDQCDLRTEAWINRWWCLIHQRNSWSHSTLSQPTNSYIRSGWFWKQPFALGQITVVIMAGLFYLPLYRNHSTNLNHSKYNGCFLKSIYCIYYSLFNHDNN